jgi:hypothetical protein
MRTKLSVFCERVMEAGWLAALILEPLFFNVYSSRVFEPDKLSLLRSIALLLIAVWGLKLIEEAGLKSPEGGPGGSLWQRIRGIPLALPTLLLSALHGFVCGSFHQLLGILSASARHLFDAFLHHDLCRDPQHAASPRAVGAPDPNLYPD